MQWQLHGPANLGLMQNHIDNFPIHDIKKVLLALGLREHVTEYSS